MKKTFLSLFCLSFFFACSSAPEIKKQEYATLANVQDFEEEYDVVWKAVTSLKNDYKIIESNKEKGTLTTDWVYSTSTEKYFEYTVNGLPRKHYLQSRFKIKVQASKQLGSVRVAVRLNEEVEKLKADGSFDSWLQSERADSSRANEILKKIELAILSRSN